jgi:protein O-GlcNAc transferase
VSAIFIAPRIDDDYSRFIISNAEHHRIVPQQLDEARRQIGALELDILFYQDIGMEPFSYFLAYSRLAPVQCVSFGHPDTTGIPTMDWWVSNDLYETANADSHYSERLFRLRGLGSLAYYYRPQLPERPRSRADHGLGAEDHLYICPQNLFKFHPDMDALIAAILRADPCGKLLLVQAKIAHWDRLLKQRFMAGMPDVMDRIVFMPRMNTADYVNLIALSDVMLDTVHFNGMNTSLEAFAVGTPVVTLAGEFQRGRHTQAMYRRMGLDDAICRDAAQYVAMAVRLGTDAGARAEMSARILAWHHVLYEDMNVVREFERFFRFAVAQRVDPSSSVDAGGAS